MSAETPEAKRLTEDELEIAWNLTTREQLRAWEEGRRLIEGHIAALKAEIAESRRREAELERQNRNANNSISNIAAELLRTQQERDQLAAQVETLRELSKRLAVKPEEQALAAKPEEVDVK